MAREPSAVPKGPVQILDHAHRVALLTTEHLAVSFRATAATTPGARPNNEDSAFAGATLIAVADGMGGHAAGEVASALTCRVIVEAAIRKMITGTTACQDVIHRAHVQLRRAVERRPETAGMATTLTFIALADHHAFLGHIGDSRAYRIRTDELTQLTTDHTMLQGLVDQDPELGQLTHFGSVVTRYVSHTVRPDPDVAEIEIRPGDRLLVCSDGLSEAIEPAELLQLCADAGPQDAAVRLVRAAEAAGSRDNATCVVADITAGDESRADAQDSYVGAHSYVGALGQSSNLELLDPLELLTAHASSPWLRS